MLFIQYIKGNSLGGQINFFNFHKEGDEYIDFNDKIILSTKSNYSIEKEKTFFCSNHINFLKNINFYIKDINFNQQFLYDGTTLKKNNKILLQNNKDNIETTLNLELRSLSLLEQNFEETFLQKKDIGKNFFNMEQWQSQYNTILTKIGNKGYKEKIHKTYSNYNGEGYVDIEEYKILKKTVVIFTFNMGNGKAPDDSYPLFSCNLSEFWNNKSISENFRYEENPGGLKGNQYGIVEAKINDNKLTLQCTKHWTYPTGKWSIDNITLSGILID